MDRIHDGKAFRMLTVIDEFTRECPAIVIAHRLRHDDVLACLTDLFTRYGPSDHIRSDNGSEFTAIAVRGWLGRVDDDAVVISNANTTVGYARLSKADRTVDYVFVHPSFRRRGFGRLLVAQCEQECGCRLCPAPPISPLGRKLFSETISGKISSDDIVNQLK